MCWARRRDGVKNLELMAHKQHKARRKKSK